MDLQGYETLTGLVERYSPTGGESAAVQWLVLRMRDLGFAEAHIDGAGNAVGVMALGGDLPIGGLLLWLCLLLWVGVPLLLAYWVFLRRPT